MRKAPRRTTGGPHNGLALVRNLGTPSPPIQPDTPGPGAKGVGSGWLSQGIQPEDERSEDEGKALFACRFEAHR
jgi:hypothetical protein